MSFWDTRFADSPIARSGLCQHLKVSQTSHRLSRCHAEFGSGVLAVDGLGNDHDQERTPWNLTIGLYLVSSSAFQQRASSRLFTRNKREKCLRAAMEERWNTARRWRFVDEWLLWNYDHQCRLVTE
jgi:hypothetical protein